MSTPVPRQKPPRAYSKTDESRWGRDHSASTMGSVTPLMLQSLPQKEKRELINKLIKTGAGDGSIAVRVNNMGYECSRRDVYVVRNGTSPPSDQGAIEVHRLR